MLSDLDKEYSPSAWSVRFASSADVIRHHYTVTSIESAQVSRRLLCESLSYGSSATEKLDVYRHADSTDVSQPLLVFVHGGYWQAGSRPDSAYVAKQFCSRYAVCVLGYDLCPDTSVEGIVEQIVRAARFIGDYAERTGAK